MRLNWYYVLVMAQHWNSRKYQSNLMIFGTILLYFLGEPCINFLTKVGKGKVLIQYISDIDTELSLLPESNKKRAENWTLCFEKSKESPVFSIILCRFLVIFSTNTFIFFTKLKIRQSFWGAEQVCTFIGSIAMT